MGIEHDLNTYIDQLDAPVAAVTELDVHDCIVACANDNTALIEALIEPDSLAAFKALYEMVDGDRRDFHVDTAAKLVEGLQAYMSVISENVKAHLEA